VAELIARASQLSCVQLQQELEADTEAQMCAKQIMTLRVPSSIEVVLSLAISAAQEKVWTSVVRGWC